MLCKCYPNFAFDNEDPFLRGDNVMLKLWLVESRYIRVEQTMQ